MPVYLSIVAGAGDHICFLCFLKISVFLDRWTSDCNLCLLVAGAPIHSWNALYSQNHRFYSQFLTVWEWVWNVWKIKLVNFCAAEAGQARMPWLRRCVQLCRKAPSCGMDVMRVWVKESNAKLARNCIFENQDVIMIMIQSNYSCSLCSLG